MQKHNIHSISAHRRIISSSIKPSVSRITSAQSRSKSNYKTVNQNPFGFLFESVIPIIPEKSNVPLKIIEKYFEEGYLINNHKTIVSTLKHVSGEVKKYLQYNFIQVQELTKSYQIQVKDPKLLFLMYESLINLDKNIIQDLFVKKQQLDNQDDNKEHPKHHFRFDILIKCIEIFNELVSSLLKIIDDKAIAIFIEQIWKAIVIILDLNTQWQQDRFQSLVDEQIEGYKERLEQMKKEYKQLEEKYQMQLRGYQLKLVIEQKKNVSLREENNKICQQYNHLEDQINELSNIEHAKGDLQNINQKLHEMDLNFMRFNKEIYDSHQQASTSIKQLAKLLTIKPIIPKSFIQQKYEQLNIHYKEQKPCIELILNPIISQIEIEFYHVDQHNKKQLPNDFLQFLFQNLSFYPSQSGVELYSLWIHADEQQFVNSRIELLNKLNQNNNNNDYYINVCQQIIGINTQFPSSHKIIEETFRYIKIIELAFLQQTSHNQNQQRSSLFLKQSSSIDFELEINLSNYSTILPQQLYEYVESLSQSNIKLIQFTYQIIIFLQQQERLKWNSFSKFYLNNINKFNYRLDTIEQFYNIDVILIWQLIIIHQRSMINKKQDEIIINEDFFEQLYQLWLYHPRSLIKPSNELQLTQSSSPTNKKTASQQPIQKSSPQLRKQGTMQSETSRKK
ncbi:unnamed protein product [Paramecium pentaurelia]|uniref:Uncharacterized protein n=1 Tax=Paramecium pentaurelia TaxID=43138 RepID=A0A8S1XN39_9CILI|nr:unnamed protein product [Paramecium pentaurelia]